MAERHVRHPAGHRAPGPDPGRQPQGASAGASVCGPCGAATGVSSCVSGGSTDAETAPRPTRRRSPRPTAPIAGIDAQQVAYKKAVGSGGAWACKAETAADPRRRNKECRPAPFSKRGFVSISPVFFFQTESATEDFPAGSSPACCVLSCTELQKQRCARPSRFKRPGPIGRQPLCHHRVNPPAAADQQPTAPRNDPVVDQQRPVLEL